MSDKLCINMKRLSNARVTLEPLSLSRLAAFHAYSVEPALYRYLEFSPFQTLEESRTYLKKLMDRSTTNQANYWYIIDNVTNDLVGTIGYHSFDPNRLSAEIGYGIAPAFWRQGYFSAAAQLVIDTLEHNLDVVRIVARTAMENTGSIRGLEQLGFRCEGVMRHYYRKDGCWMDAAYLARVNDAAILKHQSKFQTNQAGDQS